MAVSDYGSEYLLLGLRIGKHLDHFVDYYYGPSKLEAQVQSETLRPPSRLLDDCNQLQKDLNKQGFKENRENYLEKMLGAIAIEVETLAGINKDRSFEEEFKGQCDAELKPLDESDLKNLKQEFEEAYPGEGTLNSRMAKYREDRDLPKETTEPLFKKALGITAAKTKKLFPDLLPKEEMCEIEKMDINSNWVVYNSYQGNFKSIIQFNEGYEMYWTALLTYAAHEGYPGHHTMFAVAEEALYRELNQFEHAILLYNSPQMIMCEGIADISLNIIFTLEEQVNISLTNFCIDPSKEQEFDLFVKQSKLRERQGDFLYNAVYHKLIDRWNDAEFKNYLESFETYSPKSITGYIALVNNRTYAKALAAYGLGRKIIVNKFGERPAIKDFRRILERPVLPSDLI